MYTTSSEASQINPANAGMTNELAFIYYFTRYIYKGTIS